VQTAAEKIPQDGYCAIASCGATLEASSSTDSALPYLQKLLPEYSTREITAEAVSSTHTLANIGADIPLSDGEIHQAWDQLCVFEEEGKLFRPTAAVLLSLWKAIVTASTAENIDLGSASLVDDLWTLVAEEEYPRGMFYAILHHVAEPESMEVDSGSKCTSRIQVLTYLIIGADNFQGSRWTSAGVLYG
jgi:sister chromatid cohesion protein DCC1